MWKYIGTKECNDFLLSLNLFNCKDEKKYIKTLYSISNNIENNYRIYKIKKGMVNIEQYMNQIHYYNIFRSKF